MRVGRGEGWKGCGSEGLGLGEWAGGGGGSLIPRDSLQPRVYTKINGLCVCLNVAGKLTNSDFSSLVGSFFLF